MAQEPSQIREEIARTRAEIAETVQALGAKADIKSRVQENLNDKAEHLQRTAEEVTHRVQEATPDQAKETVRTLAQRVREQPLPFAIAVSLLIGVLIGRRMGRQRG
jgi:ElaB/YqjD/DUF883 family membrane-anchored ribosome-binding protein